MKTKKYLIVSVTFLLLSVFSLKAQNIEGRDFWLTFGKNFTCLPTNPYLELQIRIVCGSKQTEGSIYFTHLGTHIPFNINPYGVYDCNLDVEHRQAVYNIEMGKTDFSIHITSSEPVSVCAFTYYPSSLADVTNVLPVTALGVEYYHTSHTVNSSYWSTLLLDAYAVVATKNNTQLFHDGDLVETLNAGQVYYRTSDTDMSGSLITSNNPVAFFAVHQGTIIPPVIINDNLEGNFFQQLAPVNTWSRNFFVPVSFFDREIVRIVAAHNNTNITQTGGTLRTGIPGAQNSFTNLQKGQFVELDIHLDSAGCYIEANNPVGVCVLIRGYRSYGPSSGANPSQCWIPGLEQKIIRSLLAPFIPVKPHYFKAFYALVVTPTATKDKTDVSVGGAMPIALQGGDWYDNAFAGMSFYSMPLANTTASYVFSNPSGLIIYGYSNGTSQPVSYYYLASSAMRDLQGTFYANDIPYQILSENPICESLITFRAEIDGNLHQNLGRIKWYINGEEEITKRDSLKWSKPFSVGEYDIRMWARFENEDTISKTGTLKICNFEAAFYVNDVPHDYDTTFCNKTVHFRAETGELSPEVGHIRWFIDYNDGFGYVEEPSALDQTQWSKNFENGTYPIKMWVRFENDDEATVAGTLKVQALWIKMRNIRY